MQHAGMERNPNSQALRLWPYLETVSADDQVKMRSCGLGLIYYDCVLVKKKANGQTD